MKSLNIGQGVLPNFNSPRPLSSSNDSRVYAVLLAASLGYISVGYHLSSFNLISIFLWGKAPYEYQLSTFQNISNIAFTLGTFIVALFISFNKIKFTDYRKILILSDIMMIFGSLCSFGVFLLDSSYIFFGRFVCAEAAAINVTCILAFTREAQFYLSQSEFKAETRRFFGEGLFAVGVLVGFISSLFIPEDPIYPRVGDPNATIKGCILISIIPVAASIVRIIFLKCLGDLRSSGYAQAFTDEGLVEAEEDEGEGETLYYLKFKETKSVAKLFKEPYRRRLLICILLYILQATVGYFLLISEAYNFSTLLSSGRYENIRKTLIIFGAIFFGVVVLLGLNFLRKKVSRKIFMFLGAFCGAAGAAACLYSVNNNSFDLSKVTFAYYFVICFGFGFPVELYIEEILPAKGIQFLQAIKWVLIVLMNIFLITTKNSDLTMDKINVPLGIFFVANIITLIVICTVIPETANLSQTQINALFNGQEQNDKGTNNHAPKLEKGTSKDLDYSDE